MNWQDEYRQKLTSSAEAVDIIETLLAGLAEKKQSNELWRRAQQ